MPIVLIALILTYFLAPPNQPNPEKHWDFISSLFALVTLSSLVLSIKSFAGSQFSLAGGALLVFLVGAFLFARRQNQLTDPLLTFDIFRSPVFTGGVITAGGAMFGMSGLEMLTTQKLQLVDGFSPLHAGLTISAVFLTMKDPRSKLAEPVASQVREQLGAVVRCNVIPRSVRVWAR